MILTSACGLALLVWLGVLARPSQPHRVRERLEASGATGRSLADVSVLIPARDEASVIGRTLEALTRQGPDLKVIVVDDESTDGTAEICRRYSGDRLVAASDEESRLKPLLQGSCSPCRSGFSRDLLFPPRDEQPRTKPPAAEGLPAVEVIAGRPLPRGWGGKLWALEQGLERVDRPYTLLLDADIELAEGMLPALLGQAERTGAGLVSIMATLRCQGFWERLLVPPFVFFFKLLYAFAAVRDPRRRAAGAAGGCMLVRTDLLRRVGAFAAMRDALIDDCTLARRLKDAGAAIWLGLSRSVLSHRAYDRFGDFWRMVTRTAYTQLRCSIVWLVATTLLMALVLLAPVAGMIAYRAAPEAAWLGAGALLAMGLAYHPVVRFYGLPSAWVLTLPLAALAFLAMTWGSAVGYWRGTRATWKNRAYEAAN